MTSPKVNNAMLNAGGAANQLLRLDSAAKLPPLDGSQLLNLPSSNVTGMALIATQVATPGISQIDFTSGINGNYKEYVVRITDLIMGGTMYLGMLLRVGGVFNTSGYTYGGRIWNYNGSSAILAAANDSSFQVLPINQAIDTIESNATLNISIANPSGTSRTKAIHANGGGLGNGTNQSFSYHTGGVWNGGSGSADYSAFDGLRFIPGNGQQIYQGTFKLYGIQ